MNFDLGKVGIEENLQYECIFTTESKDGIKNAAPFGFTYLGDDKVQCHLFEGSKTLENILYAKEYACNITQDPLVFTYSMLNCLGEEYYCDDTEIPTIKDTPAYIIVDVCDVDIKTPENFPIKGDNSIYFITGKIRDFVINDESARAFNRGLGGLIESLTNFSRYKIVDEDKRKDYLERLYENQRVINKVSDEKTKQVMEKLKEEYEKN